MKTVIVIPGYNEQEYIGTVLSKCKKYTSNIVYVDDGSRDESAAIAKKLTKHVVIHETNLGKGAALRTGVEYAFDHLHADAVIVMDADDQHDPAEIPGFIKALAQYPCVFGVRKMDAGMPLFRFLWNKLVSVSVGYLFGMYIPDIPCGYKAFRKEIYHLVRWSSTGYEVELEIAVRVAKHRISLTTIDIESIYHDEDKGMTGIDVIHIMRKLLEWRVVL